MSASVFFKFLQFKVYQIRFGNDTVPSSVNEAARIFNVG